MPRSVKKGPWIDKSVRKVVERIRGGSQRPQVIRTWSRRSTITPDMVGLCGGLRSTGSGAEGTVKGARVAGRIEQGSRDRFSAVAAGIPTRKRRAVIAALVDLNVAVAGIAGKDGS